MTAAQPSEGTRLKLCALALVTAHLLVTLVHAAAHISAPVPSTSGQYLFVFVVIYFAPLAALWFVLRGQREGALLLAVGMGAAFLFGLINHFIVVSPDHISQTPAGIWQAPFAWSAAISALLQLASVVVGVMLLRWRNGR